jgi:glycosyltransferase involved in cell wall biosynthesis
MTSAMPNAKRSRVRFVARTNGVGIDRDVGILARIVGDWGGDAAISHHRSISPLARLVPGGERDDCIFFLERIKSRWLGSADRFVLIPNQERFPKRLTASLGALDHVLVKTRHAEQVFAPHHPSVRYIGFTSVDRRIDGALPDYDAFFHLAGGSSLKGTDTLIETWAEHPEWPALHVLYHRRDPVGSVPPNVILRRDYVTDDELKRMQNRFGIHLCPSLSEGWGHSIVEGMSCGAVVLTTDGPPMNELVTPDRGALVRYSRAEPRKLGTNYHVDPVALAHEVERLIAMPADRKAALGSAARAWFERNDLEFRQRLLDTLGAILPPDPTPET